MHAMFSFQDFNGDKLFYFCAVAYKSLYPRNTVFGDIFLRMSNAVLFLSNWCVAFYSIFYTATALLHRSVKR